MLIWWGMGTQRVDWPKSKAQQWVSRDKVARVLSIVKTAMVSAKMVRVW